MARKKKRKAKSKATKKKRGRPAASASGSASLLSDLRSYQSQLEQKRAAVDAEIEAITSAINAMQSVPSSSGRVKVASGAGARRGPRPPGTSLKDFIGKVVGRSNGPMKAKNITKGVVTAGYKTNSRNLSAQVSTALADMVKNKQVRKVGRGLYAG